jgi:hypothetical protein
MHPALFIYVSSNVKKGENKGKAVIQTEKANDLVD